MTVITVSSPASGGGIEVGQIVARELGLEYIDQEILVRTARSLAVSIEEVALRDERVPHPGVGRLAHLLQTFLERSAAAGAWDPTAGPTGLEQVLSRSYAEAAALPPGGLDDRTYIRTLSSIVEEIASQRAVLIVGRGGQVILKDAPSSLHVLTLAPKSVRASRLAQRDGISEEEAMKRITDLDRSRADFHHKYFKVNADDPSLYDLVVDSNKFSFEAAAKLVVAAVKLITVPA